MYSKLTLICTAIFLGIPYTITAASPVAMYLESTPLIVAAPVIIGCVLVSALFTVVAMDWYRYDDRGEPVLDTPA